MFHWPLALGTQRQRLASEGEKMGTTDSICGLYDALMAVAAAATAGDPVIALAALDSLDAESAALRQLLTVAADTAGHEPLIGADATRFTTGGPAFPAASGRDARIPDRRTRSAH
jgi:hypothetical protein